MRRFEQFGIIRFLGAIAIFSFHFFQIMGHNEAINMDFLGAFANISIFGGYAVELFFMLSGFFMAYNYENRIATMSFGDYMFGRLRKLWIPVVLSCIIGYFSFLGKYNWGGYTLYS